MSTVYVVGTGDTKERELRYIAAMVEAAGVSTRVVDVGTSGHTSTADVTPREVAAHHPDGPAAVESADRGIAVTEMSRALEAFVLASVDDIAGIIGAGGSGGTALLTAAMRSLPIGLPKVMVSTVASGNVASYVGPSDIAMMYSVTDVAGLNRISRRVLGNAAHAIAGMASRTVPVTDDKPAIGLTMFGVTTPLVTQLVEQLEGDYDALVFHATGTGGRTMEKLIGSGMIEAVLDMTTTDVADLHVGGVFAASAERLDVIGRTGIPYVGSVGACDMVNFGAKETVPAHFADRTLHTHNSEVTLMRTTAEENEAIGAFLARKLNACTGPVRFLLPLRGISMIDALNQPFHDPAADAALFDAIESELQQTENRQVIRVDAHINDAAFAAAALAAFHELTA